jgi:hypothetical protein
MKRMNSKETKLQIQWPAGLSNSKIRQGQMRGECVEDMHPRFFRKTSCQNPQAPPVHPVRRTDKPQLCTAIVRAE